MTSGVITSCATSQGTPDSGAVDLAASAGSPPSPHRSPLGQRRARSYSGWRTCQA
jgi:hypothetical protein